MALAEELGLPLLTVIDTGGAALSKEAEEGGLAGEIARSIHDLIGLNSPTCPSCWAKKQEDDQGPVPRRQDNRSPTRLASPLPPEGVRNLRNVARWEALLIAPIDRDSLILRRPYLLEGTKKSREEVIAPQCSNALHIRPHRPNPFNPSPKPSAIASARNPNAYRARTFART
jgi:hypothetical protein